MPTEIKFELSAKEAFDRQLQAIWNGGFGADVLSKALPRIEQLAKEHYLEIANSGKAGALDDRLGIETGAMLDALTKPIIQDNRIILDTSLDYAMEQEAKLAKSGRSFLPSEEDCFNVLRDILSEL
jgi:hypothetical protein